jgi:hypothetical protein
MQNRGFISQLKLWGWREKKVSGDFTTMVAPNGTKLQVRSAHNHTGNAPETYEQALAAMRVTWDEFVAKGKDEADHVVGGVLRSLDYENHPDDAERLIDAVADAAREMEAEAEAERQRIRDEQIAERDRRRTERKAARAATAQKEDTPMEAAPTQTSGRGTADRVFAVILGHSGPITNAQIADALDTDDRIRIGNATNYLHRLGVIDRVKNGVWQRKHEYSPHDMTFDIVSRHYESIPKDARPATPPTPLPTKATTDRVLKEDRDRLLDDVLDQLLPDGFMGRHLSLIARWRDETLAMIDLVESDR